MPFVFMFEVKDENPLIKKARARAMQPNWRIALALAFEAATSLSACYKRQIEPVTKLWLMVFIAHRRIERPKEGKFREMGQAIGDGAVAFVKRHKLQAIRRPLFASPVIELECAWVQDTFDSGIAEG